MACLDSNVIEPHSCISCLLKHPFFIGMKRSRTHKNTATSKVDKYQHVRVEFSLERINGLCKKVDSDQGFDVRANEPRPCTVWILQRFIRYRVKVVSLHDVTDGRQTNCDSQFSQFPKDSLISPSQIFGCESDNQFDGSRIRFWATTLARRLFARFLSKPSSIGVRFGNEHDIGDFMADQRTQSHQLCPFFRSCDYSRIINSITKHFDLILQHLNSCIISRHEKSRYENENHLQKPRILFQIVQIVNPLNPLSVNYLREVIPFRTPKKSTMRMKVLNRSAFSLMGAVGCCSSNQRKTKGSTGELEMKKLKAESWS
ncbi:hypothetical protein PDESU_01970 [Pontiella desulfatans]|uniref:Uncharacterized protein n=1 Tax=Pontiella desulfatans TaxID=2750659 RepID=A0A6C2U0L4_PONDE|nr:hypothetical protein PDESU_01970 [Pontiella desulfatans]